MSSDSILQKQQVKVSISSHTKAKQGETENWLDPLSIALSIFTVAVGVIAEAIEDNRTLSIFVLICVLFATLLCIIIASVFPKRRIVFILISLLLLMAGTPMYKYVQKAPASAGNSILQFDSDASVSKETSETGTPASRETSENTTPVLNSKSPSAADLDEIGDKIVYPGLNDYLSSYETKYVKSNKGHSVYVFGDASGDHSHLRSLYAYEKDEVTIIARRNCYSCILFTTPSGKKASGWVNSNYLVSEY